MLPKFKLVKDLTINIAGLKEIKIADKGTVYEANEEGKYIIESLGSSSVMGLDDIRNAKDSDGNLLFEEIVENKEQEIEIIVEEIPEDDDEQVKRWRIQLDVNTTRKKLKEIEKFINENIKKLL